MEFIFNFVLIHLYIILVNSVNTHEFMWCYNPYTYY